MSKAIIKSIKFDNGEEMILPESAEIDTNLSYENQLLFIILAQIKKLDEKISQTYNFHME